MLLKLNRYFGQRVILQDIGHGRGYVFCASGEIRVCLKFNAPKSILIHREEVWLKAQLKKLSSNDECSPENEGTPYENN